MFGCQDRHPDFARKYAVYPQHVASLMDPKSKVMASCRGCHAGSSEEETVELEVAGAIKQEKGRNSVKERIILNIARMPRLLKDFHLQDTDLIITRVFLVWRRS